MMIIYTPGIIAVVALTWGIVGLAFAAYLSQYGYTSTRRKNFWEILLCGPIVLVMFILFVAASTFIDRRKRRDN